MPKGEILMQRKDWFIALTVGLLIVATVSFFGIKESNLIHPANVKAQEGGEPGEIQQIRDTMLKSHDTWESIHIESTTTWFSEGKEESSWVSEVYIEQPLLRGRLELSPVGEEPSVYWIVNNGEVYESNEETGESTQKMLPAFVSNGDGLSILPEQTEGILIYEDGTQTIFRHPFGMLMPSPIADYIFPVGLAQRSGSYEVWGRDSIINRDVWVVDYSRSQEGPGIIRQRFWIDTATGIILKAVSYADLDAEQIIEETIVTSLTLNPSLTEKVFELPH
jgi:hypothetical protein